MCVSYLLSGVLFCVELLVGAAGKFSLCGNSKRTQLASTIRALQLEPVVDFRVRAREAGAGGGAYRGIFQPSAENKPSGLSMNEAYFSLRHTAALCATTTCTEEPTFGKCVRCMVETGASLLPGRISLGC